MMPGVVAGFPRAQLPQPFTLTSASQSNVFYGMSSSEAIGVYGSLSPIGASAVPNGSAGTVAPGSASEIIRLACRDIAGGTGVWAIYLTLAGNVQTRPFTTMVIDGKRYPGDVAGSWSVSGGNPTDWIFTYSSPIVANPLSVGVHSVGFI